MSESRSQWQWQPNVKIWVLAALLVPVLIGLGVWQLDRAWEKQAQTQRWESGKDSAGWPPASEAIGQPVELEGEYDPEVVWLLDNRTRDGQRGYEVLHLFRTETGPVVINRGWIAGPGNRDELPEIPVPEGDIDSLRGRVSDWPQPMVLGEVEPVNKEGWPRRVAELTPRVVSQSGYQVHPSLVRVADDNQPGALSTGWESTRMGSATHYGYAAQWFALAVLLLTLTVATSFRRYEDS